MILLIDNYDSFVYNLKRYLELLGQEVCVIRNDDPRLLEDLRAEYSAVVISPGPKSPSNAGHCLNVVESFTGILPILGVCLGMQVIYQSCGGAIVRARRPIHGQSLPIELRESPLFEGVPSGTEFARYHSLIASSEHIPECLRVTAWSLNREIMAVEHESHATFGVQFHPESILSHVGHQILSNFLRVAELSSSQIQPESDLADKSYSTIPKTTKRVSSESHFVVLPKA